MCGPVNCKTCGNTTWSGCGEHVAQVRASVPADRWCDGHASAPREGGGRFGQLFGRS